MHYQKNFLTNVIFRLDFEGILELKENTDTAFSNEISEKYPFASKEPLQLTMISATPTSKSFQEETIYRRDYKNSKDAQKTVYLFPDALVVEYKQGQYKNFDSFYEDVNFVYEAFQKSYHIEAFKRMGLRYQYLT